MEMRGLQAYQMVFSSADLRMPSSRVISETFSSSGGADKAIRWVVWVIIRELRSQRSDFRRDRFDRNAFYQPIHEAFNSSIASNSPSSHQGGQLP